MYCIVDCVCVCAAAAAYVCFCDWVDINLEFMQMQFVYFKIFRLFEILSHIFPTTVPILSLLRHFAPTACYLFSVLRWSVYVLVHIHEIHGKCLQMQRKIVARDMFVEIETERITE